MELVIAIEEASSSADLEALRTVLAQHTPAQVVHVQGGLSVVCDYPQLKDVIMGFVRIFGFREVADEPVPHHQPSSEWRDQVGKETRELAWQLDLSKEGVGYER